MWRDENGACFISTVAPMDNEHDIVVDEETGDL